MSLKIRNFVYLVIFGILATMSSHMMWVIFQWRLIPHLILIISVAVVGENVISSQGYYYYTRQETNGPFVRNMPLWIMFLWIFSVQSSFLIPIYLGFNGLAAVYISGCLALLGDFILFEPYMSRKKELWRWTAVDRGYFEFIPPKLNRFTAPPGNYITWFAFPLVANSFLVLLMLFF
jgi:hypothetical protein